MFKELLCDPVNVKIKDYIANEVQSFKTRGINPKLAVIRAGEDPSQIYYENAIIERSKELGIETQVISFKENVTQAYMKATLLVLNSDELVHGIILLRPFPKQIDEAELSEMLNPDKDVDAITNNSLADLFTGKDKAFCACTAEACMEVLKYYDISPAGKKVTIVGRSLTVGKPLAMLMLNQNATVTICHSKTDENDQRVACRNADIVVLATGRTGHYDSEYFRDGQVVLDVGSGIDADGKMHGDLNIEEITESGKIKDLTYTPVPGGIGKVTTALLLRNIIKAVRR